MASKACLGIMGERVDGCYALTAATPVNSVPCGFGYVNYKAGINGPLRTHISCLVSCLSKSWGLMAWLWLLRL